MIQIFKDTKFDFLGIRKYTFALSGALIVATIVSIIAHNGIRYGIDFTGGSVVELHFEQQIKVGTIREKLATIGLNEAIVQEEKGSTYNYLIKVPPIEGIGNEIVKLFSPPPTIEREELVGPSISAGFRQKAFLVLFLGMVVMLIYVSIRFTFRWGLCAIVALIHDVLITVGFISLFNKEFNSSTIAALLAIIGYSINDSIVLSDRVRENLKTLRKSSLSEIINKSVNGVLGRTLIMSLTTLFVLIALFIFGGRVIHDFAFALIVGTIVGTYSSVYVVASLVVVWEKLIPSKAVRG